MLFRSRGKRLQLGYEDQDMHIDDKVWPAHGSTAAHVPMHLEMKVDSQILEFLV